MNKPSLTHRKETWLSGTSDQVIGEVQCVGNWKGCKRLVQGTVIANATYCTYPRVFTLDTQEAIAEW